MSVALCLPFPMSTNRLWRRFGKRIVLSPEYKSWKIEAEGWFVQQKRAAKKVHGNFTYHITLDEKRRPVARDGDNRTKCVLDFLQRMDVIEDDKLADGGSWVWGTVDGCLIEVKAA